MGGFDGDRDLPFEERPREFTPLSQLLEIADAGGD
jgi:hypothetical protein